MEKKPISTSTFTFENLIGAGALYVDKTRYFHRLVSDVSNCYFCSRPRRFGKSLAVSILKNIFLGRKELFEGLYIAGTDYGWEEFPVIHVDMARLGCSSAENLFDDLMNCMESHAREYGVSIEARTPGLYFDKLISALREKTGKKVVILIDEYDHPLTENIDDAENLEQVRKVLENFYKIIKGQEPNERFVFMTDVTKFNKVSIFSKLNNLTDITMSRDYACMFGYTQAELEGNFAPHIDEHVREENAVREEFLANIKKWYDGFKFHWQEESVYNPVSIGQFFNNNCEFRNYWFATATPAFITRLAAQQRLEQRDIDDEIVSESSLNSFSITNFAGGKVTKSRLITLLLQTGYLTLEKLAMTFPEMGFTVRFPNYEVESSFQNILFEAYSGMCGEEAFSYVAKIIYAANEGRTERMVELFRNFLAEVPYTIQIPAEKYYQTVIFCILKMCGMEIEAESATNKGRIDAVLTTPGAFYIFEFKIDQTAEAALEQILQREYFQKFIGRAGAEGKEVRCFGMSFSTAERNITGWKMM